MKIDYRTSKGALTKFRKRAKSRVNTKSKRNNTSVSEYLDSVSTGYKRDIAKCFLSASERKELNKKSDAKMAVRSLVLRRKSLGWKQADLAAKSGIPQETISRIECGTCNVSLDKLTQLAETMGCTLDVRLTLLPANRDFDGEYGGVSS